MKPNLIFIGDAAISSGFSRASYHYVNGLSESFNVIVVGVNYFGDLPLPAPWSDAQGHPKWPIKSCIAGGDGFGIGRIKELIATLHPAVIVIQNDPWNFPPYLEACEGVPVVGIVAVDGKNCKGEGLNGLVHAIFWTEFGEEQARRGGYMGTSSIIPLGVDLDVYKVMDRETVHAQITLTEVLSQRGLPATSFIVGSVGRNQPRKRLDLTIEYFAEWVHGGVPVEERSEETLVIKDACLWMHIAPTGECAFDLLQLAEYYGVRRLTFIPQIEPIHGVPEALLAKVFNLFHVGLTTTQGEGFGLTTFEMMACGVTQIVPDWSALGELLEDAAMKIWCTSTAVTLSQSPRHSLNVIGGIADRELTVHALERMYRDEAFREELRTRGLTLVAQERYRWENIGRAVNAAVGAALVACRPAQDNSETVNDETGGVVPRLVTPVAGVKA